MSDAPEAGVAPSTSAQCAHCVALWTVVHCSVSVIGKCFCLSCVSECASYITSIAGVQVVQSTSEESYKQQNNLDYPINVAR